MRKFDSMLDVIREATLVRIPLRAVARPGARLWAQLELSLPGSMKDRVALSIIAAAEARGELQPGGVIVESSSGSMAEGLARVGTLKGYRVVIVTDPRLDEMTAAKLRALGAQVEIVEHYDPVGGWQTSRLRRLREVMDTHPGAFWACQYDSPDNPGAYGEVGEAIARALPDARAIVGCVGTGGSLCGTARGMRRLAPGLRVVAVDAAGSVLFNQPDRKRLQSGHGNSVVPGNLDYAAIDEVHWLADNEAFQGCRELAARAGIFGGGSSGAAYVAASWVASRLGPQDDVVVILPDRGDRYHASIYSDEFLAARGLTEPAASEPLEVRYGAEAVTVWSRALLPRDGSVPYHAPQSERTADVARALGLEAAVLAA